MTMTIMYLTVAFLLAALAVSGLARIRGLDFAHGGSPVDSAAILLVIGLVIDLVAQLTLGTQGWLNSEAQWNQTEAQWTAAKTPDFLPDMYLWKVGLVAQLLGVVFLVLGIWRLFAAVKLIVPPGKARAGRTGASGLVGANLDTTD